MIGPRSPRANILWAMGAKAVSLVVAVLSVPVLLQLLGTDQYGTWATLTSLVTFIGLLDLGVGNSMRNSVASMSTGTEAAVQLEFIGFFRMLCGMAVSATIVLALVLNLMDWATEQRLAASLLYLPLLLLIPMMLGTSVLQGARATGLQSVLQSAGGWVFFAVLAGLALAASTPALHELALVWSLCYAAGMLLIFALALRTLKLPAARLWRGSVIAIPAGRLRVGLEFLVLQISSLVLYSLGNALIFNHLGPAEVARYDVLNKAFQVGLSLYTIVIGVMWSEIARSRASGDAAALRRILRRLATLASLFSAACLLGSAVTPFVVDLWTQHRIQVSSREALAIAALVSVQSIAYVGAVFMNAFEAIRLQIAMAILPIALMVPVTTALMDHGVGIAAVPVAATVLTLLPMVICNMQALRLIRGVRPLEASAA